jgi:predicted neuraminidase
MVFFSAGRWNRWPFVHDEKNQIGMNSYKTYYRYTDDSGRTWSAPEAAGARIFCRSNGIRLSTGELVLPIDYNSDGEVAGVLKSVGHETWKTFGQVKSPAAADEPSIAELGSGAIMMILRTNDGFIWKTISKDKGETWAAPEKTNIVAANSSANLLRLKDGRLVLTHNASPIERTPLMLRVSSNDGESWGEPITLAEVSVPTKDEAVWNRQVSYPSATQLADGTVVVVWGELSLSDTEQYGDVRSARIQV